MLHIQFIFCLRLQGWKAKLFYGTWWRFITPPLLNLALDGGECSGSRQCRFTPGAHWIGSWVGLREGLDVLKNRIITKPTDLSCITFFIRMPNCIILISKNITFRIWKIWGKCLPNKRRLQKMKATKMRATKNDKIPISHTDRKTDTSF
jgi:hypothetical protein